jgi:hypothetical protein
VTTGIVKAPANPDPGFEDTTEMPPASGAKTANDATAAGQAAAGGGPPPAGGAQPAAKPEIVLGVDEHRVVDEAIAALSAHPAVYQRGGMPVRVVMPPTPPIGSLPRSGSPRIVPLTGFGLRDFLSASASCVVFKPDREGNWVKHDVHPAQWLVGEIDARSDWPKARPLEAVVECPVLRPDGSVLDTPGYDTSTGLLYLPNGKFKRVRAKPSLAHAVKARDTLLELVADFPFATKAGRTGWLAALLTLFARHAFPGPAPMFVFDANTPGTGKGLLTDAAVLIFQGRSVSPTPQPEKEEEERKLITAAAMEGASIVLFDNLTRPLGSGALEAVLTATRWRDRVLGVSKTFEGDVYAVWIATGNNVAFRKRDMIRRTVHIRLETDLENPESRQGFTHPDLRAWVLANRPTLVAAALTILRAYCAAGRPDQGLSPWGSFEGWSALVRSAVVWVGMEDPGKTREELARTADTELVALADLVTGWEEMCAHVAHSSGGCTAAMALDALAKDDAESRMHLRGAKFTALRSALGELISTPPGKLPTAAKVGVLFRRHRGRVVDGKKLETVLNQGNNFWTVVAANAGGRGGHGGHARRQSVDACDPQGSGTDTANLQTKAPDDPVDVHHVHQAHRPEDEGQKVAVGTEPKESAAEEREVFEL